MISLAIDKYYLKNSKLFKLAKLRQYIMAKAKKSVYRWCWGRLLANKSPIYYSKCQFWPQNLMFGKTGSLEQFKNFMKKHLNVRKTLTRNV